MLAANLLSLLKARRVVPSQTVTFQQFLPQEYRCKLLIFFGENLKLVPFGSDHD
jgi:hypothetical protein